MEKDDLQKISGLFGSEPLTSFEQGHVAALFRERNRDLGSFFTAERAVSYLNILYRLLLFKRDYELEPLYDDIFNGVLSALTVNGEEYTTDQFRTDLSQLENGILLVSESKNNGCVVTVIIANENFATGLKAKQSTFLNGLNSCF